VVSSQARQAVPPAPQALSVVGSVQDEPEQHPAAQVVALQLLQTPPAQVSPFAQVSQAAPPAPHAEGLVPSSQVVPLQQPEHEAGSHTQVPPEQRWPAPHGEPVPHWHAPLAEQPSARSAPQSLQLEPPTPQVSTERAWHTLPAQQPAAQDAALHSQAPPTQRWVASQACAAPHWHAPLAEQLSARVLSHCTQVAPPTPHVASARGWQAPPAQQPPGQETSSHTQAPPWQRRPSAHGAPFPHWQAPPDEHRSAAVGSHATQATAPTPQAETDGVWQVAPEQQPPAQFDELQALHRPPEQVCGEGHASQAQPPLPHASSELPATQVEPAQQPLQEVTSQTQVPPAHR
jgi:hypothetical protein